MTHNTLKRRKISLKDIFDGKVAPFEPRKKNTDNDKMVIEKTNEKKSPIPKAPNNPFKKSNENKKPTEIKKTVVNINKTTPKAITKKKVNLSKKIFNGNSLFNYDFGSKHIFTSAENNMLCYDFLKKVLCKCNTPCDVKKVLSDSSANKGKTYMTCGNKPLKSKGKNQKMCDYFKFEDQLNEEVEKIKKLNVNFNRFEDMNSLLVKFKMCGNEKLIEDTYPMSSLNDLSCAKKYSNPKNKTLQDQLLKPNSGELDKSLIEAFSDEIQTESSFNQTEEAKKLSSNHFYVFDKKNYDIEQVFHNIKPSPRIYPNQSTVGNILRHNYLFEERKGNPENKTILEKLKETLKVVFQKYNSLNFNFEVIYASIYQQIYEHFDLQFKCNTSPFQPNQSIYNSVIHRIFLVPYQRYKNSNIPKDQQITEIDIQGNRLDDKGFVFDGNSDLIALHWEDEKLATDDFYLVKREHLVQFLDYHVDWNNQTSNDGFKFLYNSNMKQYISTDKTNLIYKDETIQGNKKTKEEMMEDCVYCPCVTRNEYEETYKKEFSPVFDHKKEYSPKHLLNKIYHPYFVGHNRKAVAVSKVDIKEFWEKNEYFVFQME